MLDSKGSIPLMTPTQALKSIQVVTDHSCNWYDEATTKERIEEDKAVEQNEYMRSLQETIIKFCEDSIKEQAADDEWIRKFIKNTNSNIRALKTTTKNLQKKTYQLTQTVLTNAGEKVKARTTMGKENVKEPVPRDLPVVQTYVPPTKFLGSPSRTHETVCMMGIPEEIHKMKAHKDEGNTDDGWDITVKNVYRFRQILTPTIHSLPNLEPMVQSYVTRGPVHDKEKVVREKEHDYDIPLQDHVMQPLTPKTVHITPPNDNYVAPATNLILNKHLNEFGEEFTNNTRVSKKIDSNPLRMTGTKGESSRNLKDLKDHNEFAPLADNSLEVLTMNSNQLNDWIIIQRKHSADLSALAPWSLSSACFAPQHSQRKSARSDALASCDHRARDRTSLRSEEYKVDRIYEWNKDIPWVDEKPWTDTGVWTEPKPIKHYSLMDYELKEQALRNKAIMEGSISDDESINDGRRRWESHEITYHDHDELEYEDEAHDERQELCEARKLPVYNMRRFMTIKYSFGQDEEYVAIKEDEYD
ncbi:hypothetical protein Tco_0774826 [Tanacetum coccineum]|uniref:Uncharacterized protein n=1 Tax=Tanacetum coccineum TaxID=301880 RepID=A0ABQ4ZPK5_9ASTR